MEFESDSLPDKATSDTLVVYQFFEKDETYIENFLHFLVHGYREEHDHVVVVAGPCTIALPRLGKLRYLFTDNRNNDYGGYCEVVERHPAIFDYDVVFFVNSSVRGPFLPPGAQRPWTGFFKDRLAPDVGLVGSTINILPPEGPVSRRYGARHGGRAPYSHVQTMAYCLTRQALKHLHERGFYERRPALSKQDVIEDYEIRLSQLILSNGWNIASLLPEYSAIDYRLPHAEINPTSLHGDPNFANAYFGRSAHPYEVMFVKTNRDIFTIAYLERLALSSLHRRELAGGLLEQEAVAAYLERLEAIRRRTDVAPVAELRLRPAEILGFTRALLARHPQFRGELERMLGDAGQLPG